MSSDDQSTSSGPGRDKLLEEIKRRAEAAELRRIEDEEKEARPAKQQDPEAKPAGDAAPFPALAQHPPPVSSQKAREQKASVLRDRLVIALERGRIDKAEDLLGELGTLLPHDPEIAEYRSRILALRGERSRTKEGPRPPEANALVPAAPTPESQTPPGRAPSEAAPAPVRRPVVRSKSVGELLEAAQADYQQEKYDRALEAIEQVLAKEPENQVAATMREQVNRAKEITELVLKEEERRKAENRIEVPQEPAPVAPPVREERDFWGTSTKPNVTEGFELAPQEAGPAAPPRRSLGDRLGESLAGIRIPWKLILSIALILAGAFLVYSVVDFIRTAVSPPRASILVLPPAYPGNDSTFVFLGDGLAEDLISGLAMVRDVRVVAPVTALGFRNSSVSNAQLARGVGVGYFLQWSMKREGDGFFVQYALFDTLSSNSRWVYRGQSTVGNLPKLRLDVVRGILTAVGSPAEDASSRLLLVPSVIRPAAYEAFLRGTFALRNPDRYPPAFAADCFAEALLIDSAFAQAHAAYGWATMLANEAAAEPTQAATAHALASVQAAMRLGWTTSETFRVWGMAEFFRGQYQKARERFEEAVATSPSDAEAQRRLAYACVATGRYEAAVQAAQTAVQNDPGNAASHATLGNVYQFLGQYVHAGIGKGSESREALSSAVRAYEQGIRFAPDRSAYASGLYAEAMVYVQRADRSVELMSDRVARTRTSAVDLYRLARVEQAAGRPRTQWVETLGRARSLVEEELRSEPGDPEALSVLALIQTRLGQFREAQEAIRTALQVEPGNVTVMLNGGRVYALQREKVRALDLLRRALSRKYSLPDILDMDLYNLRSEEGFLAAVTA